MFSLKHRSRRKILDDLQKDYFKLEDRFNSLCFLLGIAFDPYDSAHYIKPEEDKKYHA